MEIKIFRLIRRRLGSINPHPHHLYVYLCSYLSSLDVSTVFICTLELQNSLTFIIV